jgi:hypothetical protein
LLDIFRQYGYYDKILEKLDHGIANSNRFLSALRADERSSKNRLANVPPNVTIREERVNCKKYNCMMCPHGPYYYAYWKQDGKLKKSI